MRHCPDCHHTRAYRLADGRLKCRRCGKRYRLVSAWDASRLPAATKRQLLELFVLGVPVFRQRFRSPASRPAIERFYRIVRAVLALAEDVREPFSGKLECDETTFGGAKKGKRGWGAAGKVIVFGIIKRNGLVKAMPIQAHSGAEVLRCIREHTTPGSLYYTDEWQAYVSLRLIGDHVVIRKEKGRPMGRNPIKVIKCFWS